MKYKRLWLVISVVVCGIMVLAYQVFPKLAQQHEVFAIGKYLVTVYGIFKVTYCCLDYLQIPCMKQGKVQKLLKYGGILVFFCYTVLTFDTFLFHVITWIPGMIRYAIFNAHGILYLVWVPISACVYVGSEANTII